MSDTPDLAVSVGVNQAALAKSLAAMEKRITDATKAVEKKTSIRIGGKSAEDSAKAIAREMDALRSKFDPLYARSKRYEAQVEELTKAHKVGAIDAAAYGRALDALNDEFAAGAATATKSSGGMRNFGSIAQQAGYQIGDFAVQVGSGTSALQAFGQQAPQLLGAFGMWGAIAGTAVAIGAPLARAFFDIEDEARPLSETMGDLSSATSEYVSAAEAARQPVADLRKEYGDLADEVERSLQAQERLSGIRLRNSIEDARGALAASLEGYGAGASTSQVGAYSLAASLGTSIGKAQDVAKAMDAIKKASDFAEAEKATRAFADALNAVAGSEEEAVRRFGGEDGMLTAAYRLLDSMRESTKAARDNMQDFVLMAHDARTAIEQVQSYGFGSQGLFGTGMDAAKGIIKQKEGFSSAAYWDVNHYRAGYGSDTATRADGSVYSITQGATVSLDEAERDLERRISTYFEQIIATIGPEAFQRLNETQQGVLASLLHNYGAGEFRAGGDLGSVVAGLKSGSNQGTADAIARLGSDNGGVNRSRRESEAAAFGGASDAALAAVDARTEALKRAADAAKEAEKAAQDYGQSLLQAVESAEFEATLTGKTADEQARLRAEYILTMQAKEKGIDLNSKLAGSEMTVAEAIKRKAEADAQAAIASENRKEIEQQSAAAMQAAAQAQLEFQRGVVAAIISGNSLSSVLSNLAAKLAEAALQAALFGDITKSASGGQTSSGGILSGVFNAIGGLFGGFKAAGGPVDPSKGYIVGENGPEWFQPKSAGTIVPNHVAFGGAPSGAQGGSLGIALSMDASGVTAMVRDQAGQIVAEGFAAYDSSLPSRVQQIQGNPRQR
ncbi:MAG: hypothetical protein IE922_01500 [Sphingomonadales bacterium]|nr:hypothetical protein [Sphingomonadales bacterium]